MKGKGGAVPLNCS